MQADIIKSLSEKYGLTEKQIKDIIDSQGEFMIKSFREKKTVKLTGFGRFIPKELLKKIRQEDKDANQSI